MTRANHISASRLVVLGMLAVVAGLLVSAPSSALAAQAHGYSFSFGGPGSGAGQLSLASNSGIAINDQTGDVYVADTGNRRVDEFDASGKFVRAFGANVGGLGEGTCTLVCSPGSGGLEPGELQAPAFIAVDNSSSASKGDVYVSDGVGAGMDEQQQIVIAKATGGTYTLTFEGQTTAPILFTPAKRVADAEAARDALEALSTIGPGNLDVSSIETTTSELTIFIEFIGSLQEKDVPELTTNAAGLTPAGATVTAHTNVQGTPFVPEAISKFTAAGQLVESWGVKGQLDGSSAPEGPFGRPDGIAVDGSGTLWVADEGTFKSRGDHTFQFGQEGVFKAAALVNLNASPEGVSLDGSGDLYFVNGGSAARLTSGETVFEPEKKRVFVGTVSGLAAAPGTGDLYVDHAGSSIADISSQCVPSTNGCAPVQVFGAPQLSGAAGLAVDMAGVVYAANSGVDQVAVLPITLEVNPSPGSASEVKATSATLNGEVNPKGFALSECSFEYATTGEYSEGNTYAHTVPCEHPDALEVGEGTSPVPVHAKISGLRAGTTYHYRLVAKDASVTLPGNDETFTATGPVVTGAEAREVTAGGAELLANVNPEGTPVTRCAFEYGTSSEYGQLAKCEPAAAQIGAGSEPVPVTAKLSGLSPDTTYHWRLAVTDANGEAYSPDHTLVYDTTGAHLPDGRSYEMVTPPAKNGALVSDCFVCVETHVAADGSRVIASSIQCFAETPSCTGDREFEGEPYEFTRTPAGWVTTPLAPPVSVSSANTPFMVGVDEGVALFSAPTGAGGEDEWYARSPAGTFAAIGPANPPGITGSPFSTNYHVATADLSHLLSASEVYWDFDKTIDNGASRSVYEYVGAHNPEPFLVGVTGGRGSTELISTCSTILGGIDGGEWGVLSANGRTVYFTPRGGRGCFGSGATNEHVEVPVNELYARVDGELADAHTVKISERSPSECTGACMSSPAGSAAFEGASVDGSKAFFTSAQQLTDRASEGNRNLYLYDFAEPAGHDLTDVSAGDTSGLGPRVQGVVAISADGSHVYFVAQGVLAAAANGQGQTAQPGRDNLYVYERDAAQPGGHLAFIAKLPSADSENWSEGVGRANVTPDGRFLVFGSRADLTPDDVRTDGANQIFRYDAQTGVLVRVSIGDQGYNDNGNAGVGAASIVPAFVTTLAAAGPPRGDPTMSNDGSFVFFQSALALTPHALNDVVAGHYIASGGQVWAQYAQNVYEYHAGRVYLISDGHDTNTASVGSTVCGQRPWAAGETDGSAVCLFGTDATGHNVFFTTADQLVPSDTDTQVDIYDARICEPGSGNPCVSEPPPPLPPCGGEACHGIPAATPSLLAPGSASFNGEGNVTTVPPPRSTPKVTKKTVRCKRGYVEKKVRKKEQCVRAKSKKKGKKAASRASNDRRAVR